MKTILLWDPRFPDRRPARLTVEDTVASAAVRAGVAAAANPAEAGALSAGGALDPTMLTEVVLQHGNGGTTRRVFLPYSVVMVGALAGVLASIGTPIAGGVTPTPTPSAPTIAFANTTASVTEGDSGTKTVSNVINVTRNGVTGPLTVNLSYSGTATSGTDYVAGPVSGTIADGQTSLSFDLTINGDTGVESDETIVINAVLAAYTSATASKTITVTNDDVTVTPSTIYLLDTDAGISDVDDTMAMGLMVADHKAGTITLAGVCSSSNDTYAAAGIEALLRKYGVASPVGSYKGSNNSLPSGSIKSNVPQFMRDNYGTGGVQSKTIADYPESTAFYNTIVNGLAPGQSLKVVIVGSPMAFTGWWAQATTDQKAKIASVNQMGGKFPSNGSAETNAKIDPAATAALAAIGNAGLPVTWLDFNAGLNIFTAPPFYTDASPVNGDPIAGAFQLFTIEQPAQIQVGRRHSWDPACCRVAVYGLESFYTASAAGTVTVDAAGNTDFAAGTGGNIVLSKISGTTAANLSYANILEASVARVTKPRGKLGGWIVADKVPFVSAVSANDPGTQFVYDIANPAFYSIMGGSPGNTTNDPARVAAPNSAKQMFDFVPQAYFEYYIAPDLATTSGTVAFGMIVNFDTLPTTITSLVGRRGGASTGFWELLTDASGIPQALVYPDPAGAAIVATGTTPVTPGAWAMLVGYFDGTNLKLRINGVEVASVAASIYTAAAISSGTQIGARNLGGSRQQGIDAKAIASGFLINPTASEFAAWEARGVAIATDHGVTISSGGGTADTTPNAFTFTDVTNATPSTDYTSNAITVSGIDAASPISISGGTYSKNGGAFTTATATVVNGDTVAVKGTSSASASTAVNVVLSVGGVSDTYTVTTAAASGVATASFTGTDGTNLTALPADTGQAWTSRNGSFIVANNRAYSASGAHYTLGFTPNVNCFVQAAVTYVGAAGNRTGGILLRSKTNQDFIHIFASSATTPGPGIYVSTFVGGVGTQTQLSGAAAIAVGGTATLRLEVNGSTVTPYVNGTAYPTITVTDAALLTAGEVGIRSSGTMTATTGYHIDDLSAGSL